MEELIEAKAEGKAPAEPAEGEEREPGKVVDLMAALNASVAAAKEARGEHREDATVHEMQPRKKTAAKKTTAAEKGTVRKTVAKKRSAS